jgi:hypothetical protein
MTLTLAQALSPNTFNQQAIFNFGLSVYQANGFPVQSWQPGGVERTRLMAFSTMLADVVGNYIPTYTGAGFLDYATGSWLQLTAQELYSIVYNPAGFTQGNVLFTVASGASGQTVAAGNLKITFQASGNSYTNVNPVVLPAGPGSVSALMTAAFAGASYADPSNSGAIFLTSAIPGVTVTNPASNYSAITHVGSGTGTLTLGGSPTGNHTVVISITATSTGNPATASYSLDGAAAISLGTISSVTNLGGTGINVTFTAGTGTSWALNDSYTFTTPGTWITQQGNDQETDLALANRCRNRWASLSLVPTQSLYQLLATSAPTYGQQVTQVIVIPDGTINNKVNIVVAGPNGVLPGATISGLQAYITPRARGCDYPVVQSPASLNVTLGGTITALATQLATVQPAVQAAMTNLINAAGINGTIRIAAIIDAIMNVAGTVDATGITINGVASNLTLGSSSSFVIAALQALAFTYVTQ